jgi:hypothetical protein
MTSRSYEVRVSGPLPADLAEGVAIAGVTQEPVQTVIRTGPADQAALLGLLEHLRARGVELLEVRQLTEAEEPGPTGTE